MIKFNYKKCFDICGEACLTGLGKACVTMRLCFFYMKTSAWILPWSPLNKERHKAYPRCSQWQFIYILRLLKYTTDNKSACLFMYTTQLNLFASCSEFWLCHGRFHIHGSDTDTTKLLSAADNTAKFQQNTQPGVIRPMITDLRARDTDASRM